MSKVIINTDQAPAAIGTYSQAVKIGTTVYLSGQIPLVPASMQMVSEEFAGGCINDMVKVNIFLTDLSKFATVNEIMARHFSAPYPARAAVQVSALPRGAQIEIDGVMEVPSTN